jgi:hypothetical protein
MNSRRSKLTQLWADIDFDAVGLWRHLCRYDYRRAAVGLLQDLLKELHDAVDNPQLDTDALPDGTPMRDHLIAEYRERLMQILGDPDGQQLRRWQELYGEFRYAGTDHERESFMRSPFLQQATGLVVATCRKMQAEENPN